MTSGVPGPTGLIRIGLLVVVMAAAIGTPADADLWGHLTFGRDIVTAGRIVQEDPYSFTTDRPWINHEWLSEVLFFAAYDLAGPAGLIVLKLAVIATVMTLLWWRLQPFKGAPMACDVLLLIVFIGTYWRTHTVRPQLFSVLLFAALVVVMTRVDEGRRQGLWMVPAIFAVWPNLHGGFIVGLGMLGLWIAINLVDRRATAAWRTVLIATGAVSAASTLLTPYGVRLWMFLAETVRLDRSDIQDWQPILSDPLKLALPWALTAATAGLALSRSGRSVRPGYLAMIAVLALASARVSRIDAFFAIAVIALLAPGLMEAIAKLGPAEAGAFNPVDKGNAVITGILIIALLIPFAIFLGRFATCVPMGATWLPEPEVARFVTANKLQGRMLTWFDWGQYAIWHFAPGLKVSMDGRRETVYSDELVSAHWRFFAAEAGSLALLDRLSPDYIWVPRTRPVVRELPPRGWKTIFAGPVSLIFARESSRVFKDPDPPRAGPRCFPGP